MIAPPIVIAVFTIAALIAILGWRREGRRTVLSLLVAGVLSTCIATLVMNLSADYRDEHLNIHGPDLWGILGFVGILLGLSLISLAGAKAAFSAKRTVRQHK
jgi:hypothetical protein